MFGSTKCFCSGQHSRQSRSTPQVSPAPDRQIKMQPDAVTPSPSQLPSTRTSHSSASNSSVVEPDTSSLAQSVLSMKFVCLFLSLTSFPGLIDYNWVEFFCTLSCVCVPVVGILLKIGVILFAFELIAVSD